MSYSYERKFFSYLENLRTYMVTRPMTLGGIAGAAGGAGGPPGGFIGYLPQTRVAYDTTELASDVVPLSGYSLVDNLNHIRYRIEYLEGAVSSGGGTGGGHIIQYSGASSTQREKLNFLGSVSVLDNPSNNSTDVTILSNTTIDLSSQATGSNDHFVYGSISYNPLVYINGLRQIPGTDYTVDVDGLGIVMSIAPESGDSVIIDYAVSSSSGGSVRILFQDNIVNGSTQDVNFTGNVEITNASATKVDINIPYPTNPLSIVGTNSVGSSTESMTLGRVYLKRIHASNDSLISGVSVYVAQQNDNIGAWNSYVYNDTTGSPTQMVAFSRSSHVNDTVLSNGTSWPARWFTIPCNAVVSSGYYWIGVELVSMDTNSVNIYYNSGGDDIYFNQSNSWRADADRYSLTNSGNDYSIRAALIG